MKKYFLITLILFISTFLYWCSNNNNVTLNNIEFEQVWYFKSNDNLRYFTFFINIKNIDSYTDLSEEIFSKIKEHGWKRMNTSWKVTASFYYTDRNNTPDITLLNSEDANNLAHEKKPIASVWIMPNGNINLIKSPE